MTGRCLDCDVLARENAMLTDEISGLLTQVRKLSSENTRLKNQLNGDQSSEAANVKELCAYHDRKYREAFPRSKGLDYPMEGENAKAFRKALRMSCSVNKTRFTVEDLKHATDGLFLSDFHTSNTRYCRPGSYLGTENKIREHMQRAEDFQRLVDSGMDEPRARRLLPNLRHVHERFDRTEDVKPPARCPGCGRDPEREGCWCQRSWMAAA